MKKLFLRHKQVTWISSLVLFLSTLVVSVVQGATIYDNYNIGGVSNEPSNPTVFSVSSSVKITSIMTYHYNVANGSTPGTIALIHSDGTVYGPWIATGSADPNLNWNWTVSPAIVIKAGNYTVIDSSTETWSHNSTSDYAGFAQITGDAVTSTESINDFYDGFENGSLAGWTLEAGTFYASRQATSSSSSAAAGTYSLTLQGGRGNGVDVYGQHKDGVSHAIDSSTPSYISFYAKTASTNLSSGYFIIGDSTLSSVAYDGAIEFKFSNTGELGVYDTAFRSGGSYSADTWYFIEFRNINWTTKTFDFYVNGTLKRSAVEFRNKNVTALTQLHLYNYDNAQVWFDEIKVGGIPATSILTSFPISVTANPSEGGKIACTPSSVSSGNSSSCIAIANSGYNFVSWSGDCSGNASTCILDNVVSNKSVTALFTTNLIANSTPPIPKVMANQGGNQVLMMSDMLLDVEIKLDPQQNRGQNADWWLFAETSLGTFYYDVASGWNSGHQVSYQGPLFDLPSFQVLNMGGLPPGQYVITFGVDMNMNGIQDADAYLDSVKVDITSNTSCTSHTNDSLDALSVAQQKFIAARGNPDLFNIGFISENENQPITGTGRFAYNSNIRRIESWIYNRDQTSTAIFDNGHFVEEATLGAAANIVPTQLSPSQFTGCMSRVNIVALMGEPSCTINESIGGRRYSYLRYNPGENPAATVVFENGLLVAVMAGYSRAYTTADLCSDQ